MDLATSFAHQTKVSSRVLALVLVAMGFIPSPSAADPFCEKLLRVPQVTAGYSFPKHIDVVNLRAEAEGFPVLKSMAELQNAFLAIRDTPAVRLETLKIVRKFPWLKFKTVDSGYVRIPWGFSEEHCYLRAEMGAAILADAGLALPVALSVVTEQSRLWRGVPLDEVAPKSFFPTLRSQSVLSVHDYTRGLPLHTDTSWTWHVSLAYLVEGELWLIDPSLNYDGPIKFAEWYARLAENVPRTQVEIGWPFALSDRYKAGHKLTLAQCFAGSQSEKLFGGTPAELNSPLSGVYRDFQKKALSAYCSGEIDKTHLEQLDSLLWRVAGSLEKASGFQFDKN